MYFLNKIIIKEQSMYNTLNVMHQIMYNFVYIYDKSMFLNKLTIKFLKWIKITLENIVTDNVESAFNAWQIV